MSIWHAEEELIELFTDGRPPMRAGWCLRDEEGGYYRPNGARWISLDRSAAEDMAEELNGEWDGRS